MSARHANPRKSVCCAAVECSSIDVQPGQRGSEHAAIKHAAGERGERGLIAARRSVTRGLTLEAKSASRADATSVSHAMSCPAMPHVRPARAVIGFFEASYFQFATSGRLSAAMMHASLHEIELTAALDRTSDCVNVADCWSVADCVNVADCSSAAGGDRRFNRSHLVPNHGGRRPERHALGLPHISPRLIRRCHFRHCHLSRSYGASRSCEPSGLHPAELVV